MPVRKPGLTAKKILVRAKGGVHKRTYWIRPKDTVIPDTSQSQTTQIKSTVSKGTIVPGVGSNRVYEYKYKKHNIRVASEDAYDSNWRTKNKAKVWSASIDFKEAIDGMNSKKATVAAATVALIELREKRQLQQNTNSNSGE